MTPPLDGRLRVTPEMGREEVSRLRRDVERFRGACVAAHRILASEKHKFTRHIRAEELLANALRDEKRGRR